ncbi:MAG: hypothetical protein ACRCUS_07245, partial [Anaerovoracaceae bacterium]
QTNLITIVFATFIWALIFMAVISPAIILLFTKKLKPLSKRVKKYSDISDEESNVEKARSEENPALENILRKYEITGRNVYIEDIDESMGGGDFNRGYSKNVDTEIIKNGSTLKKITNQDIICGNCKYEQTDSVVSCNKYKEKPGTVFATGSCEFYINK